jgi:hypothetical protein
VLNSLCCDCGKESPKTSCVYIAPFDDVVNLKVAKRTNYILLLIRERVIRFIQASARCLRSRFSQDYPLLALRSIPHMSFDLIEKLKRNKVESV